MYKEPEIFHNMNEETDIYKILDKWESLGLLYSLDFESKIKLSSAFEYTAKKLISDGRKINRKFNYTIDMVSFAVLRMILTKNPENYLRDNFVDEVLNKLYEYIKTDWYKDTIISFGMYPEIDIEAELLVDFIDNNYKNVKDYD